MGRPNIFDFATSELSQDAFICWLSAWGDQQYRADDEALHETGKAFLDALFTAAGETEPSSYASVGVERQIEHADVLVHVNGEACFIIEDKTDTSEHDGQLERYLLSTRARCPQYGDRVYGIYLKTGDQSDYSGVDGSHFGRIGRSDILLLLEKGMQRGVQNHIFVDFCHHLQKIERHFEAFRTAPIDNWTKQTWNARAWSGLFTYFQSRLQDGGWGYVPNARGGFMGYWWHFKHDGTRYLQLEGRKLCFKIQVPERDQRRIEWDRWWSSLSAASAARGFKVKKSVQRLGSTMTVALAEGEYLQAKLDGTVDLDRTVGNLVEAGELLDAALQVDQA